MNHDKKTSPEHNLLEIYDEFTYILLQITCDACMQMSLRWFMCE